MKASSLLIIFCSLVMTGFGGCSLTLEEICQKHLAEFEKRYEDALLAMRAWDDIPPTVSKSGNPEKKTRRPALVGGFLSFKVEEKNQIESDMAEVDRKSWSDWALNQLEEVQNLIDLSERESRIFSVRRELSSVANALVALHGYCQNGDVQRIRSTLQDLQAQTRRVKVLACPSQ